MREAPAMREAIEHLDRTPVEMKFATYIRGISATAGATPCRLGCAARSTESNIFLPPQQSSAAPDQRPRHVPTTTTRQPRRGAHTVTCRRYGMGVARRNPPIVAPWGKFGDQHLESSFGNRSLKVIFLWLIGAALGLFVIVMTCFTSP